MSISFALASIELSERRRANEFFTGKKKKKKEKKRILTGVTYQSILRELRTEKHPDSVRSGSWTATAKLEDLPDDCGQLSGFGCISRRFGAARGRQCLSLQQMPSSNCSNGTHGDFFKWQVVAARKINYQTAQTRQNLASQAVIALFRL